MSVQTQECEEKHTTHQCAFPTLQPELHRSVHRPGGSQRGQGYRCTACAHAIILAGPLARGDAAVKCPNFNILRALLHALLCARAATNGCFADDASHAGSRRRIHMPVGLAKACAIVAHTVASTLSLANILPRRVGALWTALAAAINVREARKAHAFVIDNNAITAAVKVAAVITFEALLAAALAVPPCAMALAVMCGTVVASPTLVACAAVRAAHAVRTAVKRTFRAVRTTPLANAAAAAVPGVTVAPRRTGAVIRAAGGAAALTSPALEALAHAVAALATATAVVRALRHRAVQTSPSTGTSALA